MPITRKSNADNEMVQFALQLPRSVYKRLGDKGGKRGRAEEARRLMQAGIDAEEAPVDPKTRDLVDVIARVADEVSGCCGAWHTDAFAFEVLKAAVAAVLESCPKPPGDPVLSPDTIGYLLFADSDPPATVGRALAASAIRDLLKRLLAKG